MTWPFFKSEAFNCIEFRVFFPRTLTTFRIRKSFIQHCNSELNIADVNSIRNSKLRTYKMFKNKFAMKDYLINLHDFESRKIVAKFRCSNHTLMIETGRHKKIDLEERMCKMCSQKRVEDGRHFLLECQAYNKVRNHY